MWSYSKVGHPLLIGVGVLLFLLACSMTPSKPTAILDTPTPMEEPPTVIPIILTPPAFVPTKFPFSSTNATQTAIAQTSVAGEVNRRATQTIIPQQTANAFAIQLAAEAATRTVQAKTSHNVPDVVGMDIVQAQDELRGAGFIRLAAVEYVRKPQGCTPYRVVSQDPIAGTLYGASERVVITVCQEELGAMPIDPPPYVEHAAVTTAALAATAEEADRRATQTIATLATAVEEADRRATQTAVALSAAVEETHRWVTQTTTAIKATRISLDKAKHTLPSVFGMISSDAEETLRNAGFSQVQIHFVQEIFCTPHTVVGQSPMAGRLYDANERVVLDVCQGFAMPNVIGMHKNQANTTLLAWGFGVEEEGNHDGKNPAERGGIEDYYIYKTEPSPGAIVSSGITVTIYYSYGTSDGNSDVKPPDPD
jgi:beta-lactam-binding protein with PASTA domain